MKIPLDIRQSSGGLKPFVNVHFKIPYQKVRGSTVRGILSAFVDTGSPFTIISEVDSTRLRIQISGTPRTIQLGGAMINGYEVKGSEFFVLCDDKKNYCNISIPSILVARPINRVPHSIEVSKALPSIIGVDLLLHHKLALYFDVYHKISYLEKV